MVATRSRPQAGEGAAEPLDQVSGRGRSDDGASTHFAIASPIRGGCRHQRIHRRRLDHRLESSSDALGWRGLDGKVDSNVDRSIDWEQRVGNGHMALGTRMTRSSALPQRYQTRDTRPSGPRLPRRSGAAKWISLDTCRGRDTPLPASRETEGRSPGSTDSAPAPIVRPSPSG